MPFPNEHAARQVDPGKFRSFARQNNRGGQGVDFIFGIKPGGGSELQSIRFDRKRFTPTEARRWLKDHKRRTGLEVATNKADYLHSQEYMKTFFSLARKMLPHPLLSQLHKLSMPKSGGLARWRHLRKDHIPQDPDNPGVMIAFMLAKGMAEKLALKDGTPPEKMHITMAYLGKQNDLGDALDTIREVVNDFAALQSPLEGKIAGVGRFPGNPGTENKDVVFAQVDIPGLSDSRASLVQALAFNGINVAADHDFTPHVTLSLVAPLTQAEITMPNIPIKLEEMQLVMGDEMDKFKLGQGLPDDEEPYPGHKERIAMSLSERRAKKKGRVEKEYQIPIIKLDEEQRIAYGVVLEPETEDSQGDVIGVEEIERTAHGFLLESRRIGLGHTRKILAAPVESFVAPADFKFGNEEIKKGSWVLGVKIFDEQIWRDVNAGLFQSFSVGGFANRDQDAA